RGLKSLPELEEIWKAIQEDRDLDPEDEEIYEHFSRKIAVYFSQQFIITHRRKEVAWLDALCRQVQQFPDRLLSDGTEFVLHRVIDVMIDRFLRGMGFFENLIEHNEDLAVTNPDEFEV